MVCSSGKENFNTKDEAVEYNIGYGKTHGIYHNVYWCLECGKYHLSSRKSGNKKKKKFLR